MTAPPALHRTRPSPVRTGRRRVLVALAGAGLVATAAPAAAAPRDEGEQAALALLAEAAQASRDLAYTGTEYAATWGPSAASTVVQVEHDPGSGVHVRAVDGRGEPVVVPTSAPDGRLLDVLADRYELRLTGEGRCTGRTADVVEARRPGQSGAGSVAGRFWVDRDSGLLLRREVFDGAGLRVRSSAFLDLAVAPPSTVVPAALRRAAASGAEGSSVQGETVPAARLERLRRAGAVAPSALPQGFVLHEARARTVDGTEVLHLAYSDGLSTTSLFSQPGAPGSAPPDGFSAATVAGQPVWSAGGTPRRLVWSGGGRVWTLVSDAPEDAVAAAVATLPHEALPAPDTGWRDRLARGAARLAGALNPFS